MCSPDKLKQRSNGICQLKTRFVISWVNYSLILLPKYRIVKVTGQLGGLVGRAFEPRSGQVSISERNTF